MMAFLLGFILGLFFALGLLILAFGIIGGVLFHYGKPIARKVEQSFSMFDEQLKDHTQIVYPNYTEAVFQKEDSTLEDNLV